MAEIIPAILIQNYDELRESLSRVVEYVPVVQIDACDGILTPKATWPYNKRDQDVLIKILEEDEGLPFWDRLDFEIDLMVAKPEEEIEKWINAGAKRIIIHIETAPPAAMRLIIDELKNRSVEIGLALDIDTPIDAIDPYINDIEVVQCMGIAKIGFQGQPFDERVIEKVMDIKQQFPGLAVSVDGGVSLDTAAALVDAGVDQLVVGSAIFASDDIGSVIDELQML